MYRLGQEVQLYYKGLGHEQAFRQGEQTLELVRRSTV